MTKIGGVLKCVVILLIVDPMVNLRGSAQFISSVTFSFLINRIVPDVVWIAPSCLVSVKYPSGVVAYLGNELTPTQTKDMPTVSYNAHPDKFYTLAMIDPDAPSRWDPTLSEVRHWLVTNIPGHAVSLGATLATYYAPAPPVGSGLHRYVFLVYEQPGKLLFNEPIVNNTSTDGRTNFSITKFAKKYNLGDPIAGNFFQAQNEG